MAVPAAVGGLFAAGLHENGKDRDDRNDYSGNGEHGAKPVGLTKLLTYEVPAAFDARLVEKMELVQLAVDRRVDDAVGPEMWRQFLRDLDQRLELFMGRLARVAHGERPGNYRRENHNGTRWPRSIHWAAPRSPTISPRL